MCGLIGWAGSKAPDTARLKLLGLYNQSRGKHSCGIFYDKQIRKGILKEAIFEDFIEANIIEPVPDAKIFIGHTRHATFGEHTMENAHPFNIKDKLIVAHNGTIENIYELCKKYGFNFHDIKVDSKALGLMLEQEGHTVLNEYRGAAALLIHKTEEPDSLYVYHGASKEEEKGEEFEERPLFMLKTEGGIYFSSMEAPLYAIRYNEDQIPEVVPYNKVIKVTNGKITKCQLKVDRGRCNYKPVVTHYPAYQGYKYTKPADNNGQGTAALEFPFKEENELKSSLIWDETVPLKAFTEDTHPLVFFHRGRYYKTTHDESLSQLCHGILYLDDKGYIYDNEVQGKNTYYYWQGVVLQSEKVYKIILEDDEFRKQLLTENFARVISKYSRYPVTNLETEALDITPEYRFRWYKYGEYEKSGFTAKFSNRNYCFREGILTKITCIDRAENPLIKSPKEEVKPEEEKKKKEDITSSGYSVEVNDHMLFFQVVWETTAELKQAMDRVTETALREYIRDVNTIHHNKTLSEKEITREVIELMNEAVKEKLTLEEALQNVGKIEEYIQSAMDTLEGYATSAKVNDSDEFVLTAGGVYVSKTELEKDDSHEIEVPIYPKNSGLCLACAGLGMSTQHGKCIPCEGTGRKLKVKDILFTDPELDYSLADSTDVCAMPFEGQAKAIPMEVEDEKEQDILFDNQGAADLVSDILLPELRELENLADQFQSKLHSEFGQQIAFVLYNNISKVTSELKEAFIEYNHKTLLQQINKKTILA